jgi:hypothetical protein
MSIPLLCRYQNYQRLGVFYDSLILVEWDLNDGSSDNGLSLADLDYFSDIEDEMDEDLKVAGGTGSITIKRTIQDAEDEETGSTASEFFQQMMNNGQSLDNLEFLSDMEDEQEDDVKPVQDSARLARKRTIHDVEELPLQVGILFLLNDKIIMIILMK